ncbi:DUF4145 domain-containing protein [Flavobacterium longum]|uniref:DUF4145 domain-containing protein n=1 Tax=Flavobacterium longum TaxID=1299340 RepID=UPI0039E8A107
MEISASAEVDETWGDSQMGYGPNMGTSYDVLKCPACLKINIVTYFWHEDMERNEIEYEFLYPPEKAYPLGLPDNILAAYKASEDIKLRNANAYAILTRRMLETVCIEHGAKSTQLASMLKELADNGAIPQNLVKVANGIKNFGNIGAHAGSGELGEQELPIVSALATALLEYLYSAPYLAALAESKLTKLRSKGK